MVRVGLLEQPQVIDVLNRYFVPVELNATDIDGVPAGVPGLDPLRYTWDEIPWSRVAFSGEWVLEPQGRYLLSVAHCKHSVSRSEKLGFGETFQLALENALKRHARIRAHPPGSEAAEQEEQRVKEEGLADLRQKRPCWTDIDTMTDHFVKTLRNQGEGQFGFEKKYAVVLNWPDAKLRRNGAAALGRYAERHALDFAAAAPFLVSQVAGLLDDEDPTVREAAARALYQFDRAAVPELSGDELVTAAYSQWDSRERPYEAGAKASLEASDLPPVWPIQRSGN